MEKNIEKMVSDEEIPKPAELSQLTDITSEKIQRQKKNVESETEKIQKEETLVETVKSAVIEPQVKVQINVQGKGGNLKKTRKNKNNNK